MVLIARWSPDQGGSLDQGSTVVYHVFLGVQALSQKHINSQHIVRRGTGYDHCCL